MFQGYIFLLMLIFMLLIMFKLYILKEKKQTKTLFINELIKTYEEINFNIESSIRNYIKDNPNYGQDSSLNDIVLVVSTIPEFREDAFVQEKIKLLIKNREAIKEVKEREILELRKNNF